MNMLSPAVWVWRTAVLLYLLFRLWCDGLRRSLSALEIEAFLLQSAPQLGTRAEPHTDPVTLRAYLEVDDGREFVMCNLVRLHAQPMPHSQLGMLLG